MKVTDIKKLSVDELIILRGQVDEILKSRVNRERKELEGRLERLQQFKSAAVSKESSATRKKPATSKGRISKLKRQKVAPKYRNPENTSETWAGRGLKPRWMTQALKTGKQMEDFSV